jgi:hypothetical protein
MYSCAGRLMFVWQPYVAFWGNADSITKRLGILAKYCSFVGLGFLVKSLRNKVVHGLSQGMCRHPSETLDIIVGAVLSAHA